MTLRTTSVLLDETILARIESLASEQNRTVDGLLVQAVEEYVERNEAVASSRARAVQRWHAFEADGLHVSGDDADAWLARLEAGERAPLPACRS